MKKYLIFMGMGFEITGLIVGSVFIGKALDQTYQTKGLFVVGLIVLSLAGWLARVIFLLTKIQKAEEKEEERQRRLQKNDFTNFS